MKKIIFALVFMLVSINGVAKSYEISIPDNCYITFAIDDSNVEVIGTDNATNKKITNLKEFCDLYPRSPLANTWAIEYAVEKWNENTRKVIATHSWIRSDWDYNVKPDYIITVKIRRIVIWKLSVKYDIDIFVTNKNGNTVGNIIYLNSIGGDINDTYTHRDMMKEVAKILAKSINEK